MGSDQRADPRGTISAGRSARADQRGADDLPGLVAGQRVEQRDAGRHLVRREGVATACAQLVGVEPRPPPRHDERPRDLTESVVGDDVMVETR